MLVIIFLTLFCLFVLQTLFYKLRKGAAPGPLFGVPFLGYLPFLGANLVQNLKKLQERYGSVFRLRLGDFEVLVINDYATTKEALSKECILSRPPNGSFPVLMEMFPKSVSYSNGEGWLDHRRFFLKTFRDIGLGKSVMEQLISDEVENFVNEIEKYCKNPLDPEPYFRKSIANNMVTVTFGKHFDYDSDDLEVISNAIDIQDEFFGQAALPLFLPWITKPFYYIIAGKVSVFQNAWKKLKNLILKEVKLHRADLDENNPRDYIDHYLVERKIRENKNENNHFDDDFLFGNVMAILSAGTSTMRTTMHWIVTILAAFPDVQEKIYKEILDVIGNERRPELADSSKLVYTRAALKEAQRWRTVVPLNIMRYATADTTIRGYQVPQGSFILVNLWAVNHEPKVWDRPDEFVPERFLEAQGKEGFVPFSFGRRSCPGESVAMSEYFLYTVRMVQKFEIKPPKGETVDLTPIIDGVATHPKNCKIKFLKRAY